jgi:N-acetylglucosaminyldiphosphoundecaprenol N-acetyl-beta-D-mannosaminyltransferase
VLTSSSAGRVNVLGVGVHAVDLDRAAHVIDDAISSNRKGYVSVTGVHGVMEAFRDPRFRDTLNQSMLVVPDGMPMVWVGKLQGYARISRVYGPDLMSRVCKHSVTRGYKHFLYGGHIGVAEELRAALEMRWPGIKIVGTYTPPFRPLRVEEEVELTAMIAQCAPDIIWVGLSTPKQERFMAQYLPLLDAKIMIGVGAAFDLHTGRIKDAPFWTKKVGLQWAHRLLQEPRRLWRRYLINNPAFIFWIALQFAHLRAFSYDD